MLSFAIKNCLHIVPDTLIFYENQVSYTDSFLILVLINFRKRKNVRKLDVLIKEMCMSIDWQAQYVCPWKCKCFNWNMFTFSTESFLIFWQLSL